MNGEQPKIQIFEPFGAAYELMKRILFQPFAFEKWIVIGFAAFISGAWGPGLNPSGWRSGNWNFRSTHHSFNTTTETMPAWLIPLIIGCVVVGLAVVLVLAWVASRGRFIFTDCVVKNRGAIVEPWKEYRREGNSYFLFSIAVGFLVMLVVGALVLLIFLPLGLFAGGSGSTHHSAAIVFVMVFFALVFISFAIFFAVVSQFMVAVMYRRRCRALKAFQDVARLILHRPGPFILFVLFSIVLAIGLAICATLAACLTCCIAALPYVSTVVLLPAFVWLLAFKLIFLRQFGPEYDVWAVLEVPVSIEAPAAPPPIQPPPPSVPPLPPPPPPVA
jgi:MFS family permease